MQRSTKYFKNLRLVNRLFFFVTLWFFIVSVTCVNKSDVLISLFDREITKSEFLYFFHKNYNDSTEQNIDLYLNQFIDMHLKLVQARQQHLERNIEFINDLTNYRIYLAAPYLTDRQTEKKLAREAYERMKFEVNASHILIKINGNDTLGAYNKALQLRNKIIKGEPFEEIAYNYSDDPNAKVNSGNLGYFSAFQSNYYFEKAIFNMNLGDISMPVRSKKGYHIIECNDKRKNRNLSDALPSFEEAENKLTEWIKRQEDPRYEIIRESFSKRLKKEWNFTENRAILQTLLIPEQQTFNKVRGIIPGKEDPSQILCTIDGENLTIKDFFSYISDKDTTSDNSPVVINIPTLYKKFVTDRLITYENFKLEDKYPEFRFQLWEYRDATLLLEITKQQVWQKAATDSLGLAEYYNSNIKKYKSNVHNSQTEQAEKKVTEISNDLFSDYQTFLMKTWIEELHKKYKVQVNQNVLSSIKESLKKDRKL